MTVPDWLAKRGGSLAPGIQGSVFVLLGGQPQYRLDARPATGKVACAVTQTANGKRLDDATAYADVNTAMAGGLEQLRTKLGW